MTKNRLLFILIFNLLVASIIVGCYFYIFSGGLSHSTEDWTIASQIINGFIITALTCTNIWIFFKLTLSIEDKNEERIIKSKVFEVQSIITQMRIKKYERINDIINERKVELVKMIFNQSNYETLKKELMSIDDSFLFKGGNLEMGCYLHPSIETLLEEIRILNTKSHSTQNLKDEDIIPLFDSLNNFINIMELYIIGQMVTDNDIANYIQNTFPDCTMKCIVQFLEKAKLELETSSKQEKL